MKLRQFVGDYSGFWELPNPFEEGTSLFKCLKGIFVCESNGDTLKWKRVLRKATKEEIVWYNSQI